MPELPEVETAVRDLRGKILNRIFLDVWTDFPSMVSWVVASGTREKGLAKFKKGIEGKKILEIWRRGKNIIFDLSGDFSLLIHQKLTGHLLTGHWMLDKGSWKPKDGGPLEEKTNRYIHLLFFLDDGQMLALSDLRKFAKAELWTKDGLLNSPEMTALGPEPLEKGFTLQEFKNVLPKRGQIKQVLMDQKIIAGIGNIYSDEILFEAALNPFKDVSELNDKDLKKIYKAIKKILRRGIELGGTSVDAYRRVSGQRGRFQEFRKVYQREGEKCFRCGAIIQRKKISGRSAHFCSKCQK